MSETNIQSALNELRRIGRNFDKDSLSRKTTDYAEERLEKLNQIRLHLQSAIAEAEEEGHDCREINVVANDAYQKINKKLLQILHPTGETQYANDERKYTVATSEDGIDRDKDDGINGDIDNGIDGENDTAENPAAKSEFIIMSHINLSEALRLTPDYDGSTGELHRFINACETTLSLLSEEDKLAFVKIIKLKLKDKAYEVVKYTEYTTFTD